MVMNLLTPPEGATIIRVSERHTWEKCKLQWHYAYKENLEQIREKTGAREFGTAVHNALKEFYKAPDYKESTAYKHWLIQGADIDDEYQPLGGAMLTGYVKKYKDEDVEPLYIEHTFYAPIPGLDNVWLSGTPDLVCKYNGSYAVFDHKTYTRMLNLFILSHDDQMTAYMWLLEQNGIRVNQLVYNMLRKSAPRKPQLLKKGGLSVDKSIITDVDTYMEAIVENKLNPDDYAEILSLLETKEEFFKREVVIRSRAAMETFAWKLGIQAKQMVDPEQVIYPNDSFDNCKYCDFEKICTMQTNKMAKSSIDVAIQEYYRPRQVRLVEEDIEE